MSSLALCVALVCVGQASAPKPPAAKGESLSDAERISRLERGIEADRKLLEALKRQLDDPASEYAQADAEFKSLDADVEALSRECKRLRDDGKLEEADKRKAAGRVLELRWKRSRDRFDLAIEERKAQQEKAANLQRKIDSDHQALLRLRGEFVGPVLPEAPPADKPGPVANNEPLPKAQDPEPTATKGNATAQASATGNGADPPKKSSAELDRARKEADAKERAAQDAKDKAASVAERIDALKKNLDVEQRLLDTARRRSDQAEDQIATLEKVVAKRLAEDPPGDVRELQGRLDGARQRLRDAQADVAAGNERVTELQGRLAALQAEQIASLQEARRREEEAKAAEARVARLENPFALHNVLQWLLVHGPKLLLIVGGALTLHRVATLVGRRVVGLMTAATTRRGAPEDRENRAATLSGVFRNTASLAILGGALLMLLDEVGIPILPLMGGAAVLGLAVAFGAQNLIRDYFSGFMVLLEDQYGVNDVIRVGGVSGQVENITLRMTVVRDMDGVLHFIPHGTITTVSNLTHGWSRARFEVGVGYREDVDRVMDVLMDLAREMRRDPAFGPVILDEPQMLGVDELGDSAVVIKFLIKTRPLQQWPVKRELLRRIKRRFDELGIEIPFPHRVLYVRHEEAAGQTDERPGRAA